MCFYDLGRDYEVATKIALSSRLIDDDRLTRPVYTEAYLSALFDQIERLELETAAYTRAVLLPYARHILTRESRLAPQLAAVLEEPAKLSIQAIIRLEPAQTGAHEIHTGVKIDLDGEVFAYWRDGYNPSPGKIVRIDKFGQERLKDLLRDEAAVAQLTPAALRGLLAHLEAANV
jgi:hypothetical protein